MGALPYHFTMFTYCYLESNKWVCLLKGRAFLPTVSRKDQVNERHSRVLICYELPNTLLSKPLWSLGLEGQSCFIIRSVFKKNTQLLAFIAKALSIWYIDLFVVCQGRRLCASSVYVQLTSCGKKSTLEMAWLVNFQNITCLLYFFGLSLFPYFSIPDPTFGLRSESVPYFGYFMLAGAPGTC